MEATSYSVPRQKKSNKDEIAYKITDICLFSFGTGISRQFLKPMEAMNPKRPDVAFWLNWIMTATGQDASAMQVDMFR